MSEPKDNTVDELQKEIKKADKPEGTPSNTETGKGDDVVTKTAETVPESTGNDGVKADLEDATRKATEMSQAFQALSRDASEALEKMKQSKQEVGQKTEDQTKSLEDFYEKITKEIGMRDEKIGERIQPFLDGVTKMTEFVLEAGKRNEELRGKVDEVQKKLDALSNSPVREQPKATVADIVKTKGEKDSQDAQPEFSRRDMLYALTKMTEEAVEKGEVGDKSHELAKAAATLEWGGTLPDKVSAKVINYLRKHNVRDQ